jgi:hypothetical protein
MRVAIVPLVFGLFGCGMEPETRPTRSQLAEFCGVQVAELTKAQAELKAAAGTDVLKVGSCSLVKDYSGNIKVVATRPPPKATDQ